MSSTTTSLIYEPPWPPFQIGFSSSFATQSRCAIASFVRSSSNFIHIVRLVGPSVINEATVPVIFPQTHVQFSPLGTSSNRTLMISTADCLRVWHVDLDTVTLAASIPNDGKCEILTSADWSPLDNMVIAGTTEGAVSMLDMTTLTPLSRIVAHDHQVHDVKFITASPTFVTAGLEGSVRFFDIRDLMSSFVYFQTAMPLLRVSVSPLSVTKIATFSKDSKSVSVIDTRSPGMPVHKVRHQAKLTSINWSSLVEDRLFSTDAGGNLMMTDLTEGVFDGESSLLYHAPGPIQNAAIALTGVAIVTDTTVELVKGPH
jgi:WD repeat-containing protein 68